MLAEDLLASVFPDAAACLENIPGDREIPDHPLVSQTIRDCLEEAMDFEGLRTVLERIHRGDLQLVARDTPEPSVLAYEILDAKPYAFLDDAPLEERRSHAVQTRRGSDAAGDLGTLDPEAIARVVDEERPDPRDADELHDALMTAGFLTPDQIPSPAHLDHLQASRRAATTSIGIVAAERLPELLAVHPAITIDPVLTPPASRARVWARGAALAELLRGRLTIVGPSTAQALAASLAVDVTDADAALLALESEGVVLRGKFTPALDTSHLALRASVEWCDRALLARIHRYTVHRLRAEIEPVSPADFMRFLFKWQHVDIPDRLTGPDGLREIVAMLDGFELAAAAWERSVLLARMDGYDPSMIDMLCLAGEVAWGRLSHPDGAHADPPRLAPATPIALFLREHAHAWQALRAPVQEPEARLTADARSVLALLRARGASFFADLRSASGLDDEAARRAVGSLVAAGLASSDGFSGVRALMASAYGRPAARDRRAQFAGRWTAIAPAPAEDVRVSAVEAQGWTLLRRYGVVFRRVLARETIAAPWRELTRVYRRLEARGEIRGGRFVSGMPGEQFALPGAVERLREVRRTVPTGRLLTISTADPLNLVGIVTAGERIRAAARNRVAYRDGVPLAVREGDFVRHLAPIDPAIASDVSRALSRRPGTTASLTRA
jgi:ATP-dependent Lhr-like helicase